MAWGQSLAAVRNGIAEWTPNVRASYEAAETTPRSCLCPPTTTALPLSDGSNSSSTETKNASISTWKMVFKGSVLGYAKVFRVCGPPEGVVVDIAADAVQVVLAADDVLEVRAAATNLGQASLLAAALKEPTTVCR